jgi:hydroxypyruvate isomerase
MAIWNQNFHSTEYQIPEDHQIKPLKAKFKQAKLRINISKIPKG